MGYRIYPQLAYINAITNQNEAVVTFTSNHDFVLGQIVSFNVTPAFGMFEIQGKKGKVIALTSDTITVDINTTTWNAFNYLALNDPGTTPPTCVPVSSGVIPNQYPETINLQDAFDNRRT